MRASSSSRDFFHLGSSALALGLALGQAMSAGAVHAQTAAESAIISVSYTHLDVYKRQSLSSAVILTTG